MSIGYRWWTGHDFQEHLAKVLLFLHFENVDGRHKTSKMTEILGFRRQMESEYFMAYFTDNLQVELVELGLSGTGEFAAAEKEQLFLPVHQKIRKKILPSGNVCKV